MSSGGGAKALKMRICVGVQIHSMRGQTVVPRSLVPIGELLIRGFGCNTLEIDARRSVELEYVAYAQLAFIKDGTVLERAVDMLSIRSGFSRSTKGIGFKRTGRRATIHVEAEFL